jgi:hypothetical protein
LIAGDGGSVLDGGPGDDTITGGPGNDGIAGGPGADTIAGGAGADTIARVDGRGGGDSITVRLVPTARVRGRAGDDPVYGSSGSIDCGSGIDRVVDEHRWAIVGPSCEHVVNEAFAALDLRRNGRRLRLRLRLRTRIYFEPGQCGAVVSLRPAGGGPLLARLVRRMPESSRRRLELVAARRLPAQLRVEGAIVYCPSGGRPTVKRPATRPESDRSPLRFVAELPGAGVG